MDLELAARLRDIHPPPTPSWWPPAPGWWIAFAVAVILAVVAVRFALPRWRRWRMRRRLLAALDAIAHRHRAGAIDVSIAAEVSQLLRVAALERFPQSGAAGLHGAEWVAFLEARDAATGRFEPVRAALTAAPYCPPGTHADAAPLLFAARGWLRAVI